MLKIRLAFGCGEQKPEISSKIVWENIQEKCVLTFNIVIMGKSRTNEFYKSKALNYFDYVRIYKDCFYTAFVVNL